MKKRISNILGRRQLVQAGIAGTMLFPFSLLANQAKFIQTASGALGPFYPDILPLDTDNDLVVSNDNFAIGDVTHLYGKVVYSNGDPLINATIEIWQADNQGIYLHSDEPNIKKRDANFQGYGRFLTNLKGEYYFRTIKPIEYNTGVYRTPHIHIKVSYKGQDVLVTQLYIKDEKSNLNDPLFLSLSRDEQQTVARSFTPVKHDNASNFVVNFPIVINRTPNIM